MPDTINHNLDLVDSLDDVSIDAWYRLKVAVQLIDAIVMCRDDEWNRLRHGSELTITKEIIEGVRDRLQTSLAAAGHDLSDVENDEHAEAVQ